MTTATTFVWDAVSAQASLWRSKLHGELHANRVSATGLQIATLTPGADPAVCFVFGLLHDAARINEGGDPEHGPRAADLAERLRADGVLTLTDEQMAVLSPALHWHTKSITSNDPTIGACFDADRLNIQRLGARHIRAELISTAAALGLVDWAHDTLGEFIPWATLAAAADYI